MCKFQTRVRRCVKSDAIAVCVKTYLSDLFIKIRTNVHEMQNRIKIVFCVKPFLPSILLLQQRH